MSDCYIVRHGGSGELNFRIVGSVERPAAPAENTIWINTAQQISGYCFAAEPPQLEEGQVFIRTGINPRTAFNALKKDRLMVYPTAALQMSGGETVARQAEIYKDGEWLKWIRYIFDNGSGDPLLQSSTEHAGALPQGSVYRLNYDVPNQVSEMAAAHVFTAGSINLQAGDTIKLSYKNLSTQTDFAGNFTGIALSVIPPGSTPSISNTGDIPGALAMTNRKITNANGLSGSLELQIQSSIEGRIAVTLGAWSAGYPSRKTGNMDIMQISIE